MKIYLSHASAYDFHHELYLPIKQSALAKEHNFIFPHADNRNPFNSFDSIVNSDLLIAEVSYPSTGQGIELGWANKINKPIFCIYQNDKVISSSLKIITDKFYAYSNQKELLIKIKCCLINDNANLS